MNCTVQIIVYKYVNIHTHTLHLWRRADTGRGSSRILRTWNTMSPACTWCPEATRCRTDVGAHYQPPDCVGSGSGDDGASVEKWATWARGIPCRTACARDRWIVPAGIRRSRPWSFYRKGRSPVYSFCSLGPDSPS